MRQQGRPSPSLASTVQSREVPAYRLMRSMRCLSINAASECRLVLSLLLPLMLEVFLSPRHPGA